MNSASRPPWLIAVLVFGLISLPALLLWWHPQFSFQEPLANKPSLVQDWYDVWWDRIPDHVRSVRGENAYSNITPEDYVGPETCGNCHQKNYQLWSQHPHRWMNAVAKTETVKGRFDGLPLPLRGGTITPYEKGGQYWMRLEHGDLRRELRITHTIGSRFQQYYVGVFESGDWFRTVELAQRQQGHGAGDQNHTLAHVQRQTKVVLPIGYRMKESTWAPTYSVVTVNDTDATSDPYEDFEPLVYYDFCAKCHTTMPQGYRMLFDNNSQQLGKPPLHFELRPFLEQTLADMTDTRPASLPRNVPELNALVHDLSLAYSPERAVTLGISCEACHYGGREHADSGGDIPPRFFPSSPHLVPKDGQERSYGRTAENINLVCAQCHSAPRLLLPGGAARVNSSEYRDARAGSCYSQLSCVHCHEPHTAIGSQWPKTPEQDDASCLACHKKYEPGGTREQHTHHRLGTAGSRCMNCHMPHVTEGMEDMVRTHQISSPTKREIVELGGANACNLCHLDQTIDWTLGYLARWYRAEFDAAALAENYKDRDDPLGKVWVKDRRSEMRMIVLGAIKRNQTRWLTPHLVDELNDFHLINRQFAQNTIESVLGLKLAEAGYYYWMEPLERLAVLEKVRAVVERTAHQPTVAEAGPGTPPRDEPEKIRSPK